MNTIDIKLIRVQGVPKLKLVKLDIYLYIIWNKDLYKTFTKCTSIYEDIL